MKVAIVSESPADEAAIAILIDALTGRKNEFISSGRLRAGGWSAAINAIDVELKYMHFNTDGHGIVAVVDSDDSPIHDTTHEVAGGIIDRCRICAILQRIQRTRATLRARHVNYPVLTAIGLAVPALEAWLLLGKVPHIAEAKFERDRNDGIDLKPARKQLKRQLYGKERPSQALEREVAIREATRISENLAQLEEAFPKGFRRFAQQIRAW